jgi:hypothetical protein
MDAYEHLIVSDHRLVYLAKLENVRGAVPLVDDRFHSWLLVVVGVSGAYSVSAHRIA